MADSTATSISASGPTVGHSTAPRATLFTCNTCGIKFTAYELQKLHMKSDWHRYNLKRRVAELPTISAETYAEKVQQLKNANSGNRYQTSDRDNGANAEYRKYHTLYNVEVDGIDRNIGTSGATSRNNKKNYDEDEYGFAVYNRKKNSDASKRQLTKKDLKRMAKARSTGTGVGPSAASAAGAAAALRHNRFDAFGNPVTGSNPTRSFSPVSSIAESEFSLGDSIHSSEVTETESNAESEIVLDSPLDYRFSQPLHGDEGTLDFDTTGEEETDDAASEISTDDEEDFADYDILAVNGCIYCNATHDDFEQGLEHMYQKHGLYIPDKEFLRDAKGLVKFLWDIVSVDHECLNCGFIGKNLESIQDHNISKGHCRMPYELPEERELFSMFYKYPEGYQKRSRKQKSKSPEAGESSQIIEDDKEGPSTEGGEPAVDELGIELALPSGYRVGHRSMMRYYRQNPRTEVQPRDSENTVLAADKRLVNLGGLTQRQYDKQFSKMLKGNQKQDNVAQRRKYNNLKRVNYQPHYFDPNLMC